MQNLTNENDEYNAIEDFCIQTSKEELINLKVCEKNDL